MHNTSTKKKRVQPTHSSQTTPTRKWVFRSEVNSPPEVTEPVPTSMYLDIELVLTLFFIIFNSYTLLFTLFSLLSYLHFHSLTLFQVPLKRKLSKEAQLPSKKPKLVKTRTITYEEKKTQPSLPFKSGLFFLFPFFNHILVPLKIVSQRVLRSQVEEIETPIEFAPLSSLFVCF